MNLIKIESKKSVLRQLNVILGIVDGYWAAAILNSNETFCITGCLFRGSKHDIKHSAV
jgi:hypothetical protein